MTVSLLPYHSVSCQCRVRVHGIAVQQVIEALQRYRHDPEADGNTSNRLRPWTQSWIRCPCRPEKTDREHNSPEGHEDKPRLLVSAFGVVWSKPCVNRARDDSAAAEHTCKDAEKGTASHDRLKTSFLLERDWVREEEEVYQTVCAKEALNQPPHSSSFFPF